MHHTKYAVVQSSNMLWTIRAIILILIKGSITRSSNTKYSYQTESGAPEYSRALVQPRDLKATAMPILALAFVKPGMVLNNIDYGQGAYSIATCVDE